MDLSGHSTSDYDLCIIEKLPEKKDPDCETDSDASSDSSSEESDSNGSNSSLVKRFSFWNTGCKTIVDGSSGTNPTDRIGSENVSRAESDFSSKITEVETARLSKWNTSCTLQRRLPNNNIKKDFRSACSRKFKADYKKRTKRAKYMLSSSVRTRNIVSDLSNRQMHGTSSNFIPTDVFARMKLLPIRFTYPETRITCALIDHKCEHVIVAPKSDEIQIWNLKTFMYFALETPLRLHERVVQMTLNPDGQILVVGTSSPGKIIAYDWTSKRMFFNFWVHKCSIASMKFAPQILGEVSWLCTMSDSRKIALWPFVKSKNSKTSRYYVARIVNNIIPGNNMDPVVLSRGFSMQGFAGIVNHILPEILEWPLRTNMQHTRMVGNFNPNNVEWPYRTDVSVVELDKMTSYSYPDGEIFNSKNRSSSISGLFPISRRNELFMSTKIDGFDFSPLGKYIVFAREDNTLQSYALHVPDYIPRVSYKGPSGQNKIVHIKWANTKRAIISCQLEGCAIYRDTRTMTKRNLEMHGYMPDWPCVAEWSCDDRLIFTIGRGHTVYVWLSENLTVLHTFETRATIRTLQPNPIHPFILNVVFSQGGMELWNVDGSTNNRYLDTYEVDNNFTPNSQFCWAEWSKDGTMLAARSFKNTLTLYSLYQGIARVDCLIEKN